ncbi:MAG: hypothetical protein CMQ05_11710 [Gammaproteobacteria bacterium]|nr:hypothetical protein [Gammaproteobacteria bacterium]RPG25059.1 MAG: SDR family NAD(P)-dependent oxidoreductase [Gammaproteobacteria bacterium TMED50]|tara:strand:- start:1297 stop:2223 length:927 start_codon:yes stop_codon:yes gene_type:complete
MSPENPFEKQGNGHGDLGVLAGGVAIVTGGASGIGLALVEAAIAHGMHPVIADIEATAIAEAESTLAEAAEAAGLTILGCHCDVSSEEAVQAMAERIDATFPDQPISLLACNAGVGAGGGVLAAQQSDWDFVLGVNLMGPVYCIRTFVPKMLEQGSPGSVMATSSQDGLCASQGVYGVSKHACVALMEGLHGEVGERLTTHVLCPNVVATNIVTSERNRPDRYGGPRQAHPGAMHIQDRFKEHGIPPSQCAAQVFEAMQDGTFYVMAESEDDPGYVHLEVETRMNSILSHERPFRPQSQLIRKVFSSG